MTGLPDTSGRARDSHRVHPPHLIQQSATLWHQLPLPTLTAEPPSAPPHIGGVGTGVFTQWVNDSDWNTIAAYWPSLDASQRITTLYALADVPLPPGYGPRHIEPSDWLVAVALAEGRFWLLTKAAVGARQWALAWHEPRQLVPAGLRTTPLVDWLDRTCGDEVHRHNMRRAVLTSGTCHELPFELVWDMAQPLTDDTVEPVAAHPAATAEALAAVGAFRPLSPPTRARLAANPRYPADQVAGLYREAEAAAYEPLLDETLTPDRLVPLLSSRLPGDVAVRLVRSQSTARSIALRLTAPLEALVALFAGLDVSNDTELRDAALQSGRAEARQALATTINDAQALARLASDPDATVRSIAAQRVIEALHPNDPTA